jgi:hypothetical protein
MKLNSVIKESFETLKEFTVETSFIQFNVLLEHGRRNNKDIIYAMISSKNVAAFKRYMIEFPNMDLDYLSNQIKLYLELYSSKLKGDYLASLSSKLKTIGPEIISKGTKYLKENNTKLNDSSIIGQWGERVNIGTSLSFTFDKKLNTITYNAGSTSGILVKKDMDDLLKLLEKYKGTVK